MKNSLQIRKLGEKKLIKIIEELVLKKTGKELLRDDSFFFDFKNKNLDCNIVLNSDMLVSTTDVPPLMNSYQIGRKSVIMNVSDLLVKGVKPNGLIISFGLPKELEKKEYIEGKWKTQGKRRRKIYTITPVGLQLLEAAIKKQQQIAETLAGLIREYAHEILDTDVPQPRLPLSISIFTMFNRLKEKPLEEQKRILENLHEQLQTALTRINERLRQLHAEN